MTLLYISALLFLLACLFAAISRLTQAQDDLRYHEQASALASRDIDRAWARRELRRATVLVAVCGVLLLCWLGWLVWVLV